MHTTRSNLQSLNIFQDEKKFADDIHVFKISKGPMRRLDDNPVFFNLHVPIL